MASASPRRKEIFRDILVRPRSNPLLPIFDNVITTQGVEPEIIPSTFEEKLPHSEYADNLGTYASATAQEKGIEVYTKLVKQSLQDPSIDPPDLVISADTVIVTCDESLTMQQILEKPSSKKDNLRMLLDLNGKRHQVYTVRS